MRWEDGSVSSRFTGDILIQTGRCIYLPGVVETLPDDAVHDDPGQEQEAEQVRLDLSHLVDSLTGVENFIPEKNMIKIMNCREQWSFLLPELLHGRLGVVLRYVQFVGSGVRVVEAVLRVPALLISPGAVWGEIITQSQAGKHHLLTSFTAVAPGKIGEIHEGVEEVE